MSISADQKVTVNHLQRDASLDVRQSTIRQVFENTESTKRQYELRQRAIALGWQTENVIVIDSDLGQSGASAAGREGFLGHGIFLRSGYANPTGPRFHFQLRQNTCSCVVSDVPQGLRGG